MQSQTFNQRLYMRDTQRKAYPRKAKNEAVERLRNGEDLLALSAEYGVTAGRILFWKKIYGSDEETQAGLPEGDELIRFLKRELELLRHKNEELRNELRRMGCTPLA